MSLQGIIFDFNGTMFFDNDKHVAAWGRISKEIRGYDVTMEELKGQFNGTPNHENIQYMLDGKATKEHIDTYAELKESYYREYCRKDQKNFHLVAGVEAYMDELKKKGIPFTIASASIKSNMDFFIESFQLDRWMKPEDIVYDDGTYKNKILMFQKAADVIGVDMKDVRIYEDSDAGVTNAYAAGCRDIVVVCENEDVEHFMSLPGVTATMKTFEEITG